MANSYATILGKEMLLGSTYKNEILVDMCGRVEGSRAAMCGPILYFLGILKLLRFEGLTWKTSAFFSILDLYSLKGEGGRRGSSECKFC